MAEEAAVMLTLHVACHVALALREAQRSSTKEPVAVARAYPLGLIEREPGWTLILIFLSRGHPLSCAMFLLSSLITFVASTHPCLLVLGTAPLVVHRDP